MVNIKFPDGAIRQYLEGITPLDIAKNISKELARDIISASVDGFLVELSTPINKDCSIKLFSFNDEKGKEAFWHSSAHVLAQSVQYFYPDSKLAIGPAIENGFYYDIDFNGKDFGEKDFEKIEKKFIEFCEQGFEFKRNVVTKEYALEYYKDNEYKVELIKNLNNTEITFYSHSDFKDLCRGGHIHNTSIIKAVKILGLSGAYWRGNEKNKQLSRIYAISFPKKSLLDEYLNMLEEAKKRDHRKIGKELEIFTFSQKVGMGLPLWLPKGAILRDKLERFLKNTQVERGYEMVSSPHIGNKDLYITSGHYEKYGADSFKPIKSPGGEEYMLKPMNCPHHCEIYRYKNWSYKDLPKRYAEFGTVYRYEQSGELHGLTRVRGFTQDDAHIFCTPDQLLDEFKKVIDLVTFVFEKVGFNEYVAQISLRDMDDKSKYIGSHENWEKAEQAIIIASEQKGLKTNIVHGEAAFYGPKLDFMVKDAIGRSWQLGTIQVDYNLPERFDLAYRGADDRDHRPIMIHRAPFGSIERFIAILLEHTSGELPIWLAPEQFCIIPVSENFNNYAEKVFNLLKKYQISGCFDIRKETLGKRIRQAEMNKIPYIFVIGEREEKENKVSVRKRSEGDRGMMSIEEILNLMQEKIV